MYIRDILRDVPPQVFHRPSETSLDLGLPPAEILLWSNVPLELVYATELSMIEIK
jgi:hypothetical protein